MNKVKSYLSLIVLVLVLFSCSEYSRVRKKGSFDEKYKMAMELYDGRDFFKSSVLFEQLLLDIRGRKEAEAVNYYYAMTQYEQRQYLISAHHFQQVYTTFPRSEFVEDSRYMHAMSLYMLTPIYYLDQSYTNEAIDNFQDYLNKYPNTNRLAECNQKIDELRYKLEQKDFDNAKLFYKVHKYKAAVIALDNFLSDFPGSAFSEEAMYTKILSQSTLAQNSLKIDFKEGEIIYLKRDRYREVVYFYLDFIDKYPQSEFTKEAEKLYSIAKNNLKTLEINS